MRVVRGEDDVGDLKPGDIDPAIWKRMRPGFGRDLQNLAPTDEDALYEPVDRVDERSYSLVPWMALGAVLGAVLGILTF
jgi:hypothetical protein